MKAAIRYGLFPANFAAGLVAAYFACERGWDPALALAVIVGVTVVIIAVVERLSPYYPNWNRSRGDVKTDLLHATISQMLLPKGMEIGIRAALVGVAATMAERSWTGIWPRDLDLFLQLALAMLTTQFVEYWWHRMGHEIPLLWRFHATHHSPRRLYWLNAARFHPVDTAVSAVFSIGALVVAGAGADLILIYSVWVAVHGLYQHCNIDLRLGPLNYIFSMAELHRWHHSLSIEEANHNYGNNIILWDIVFGTMFWPKDREPSEDIGLDDIPNFPEGYLGQLLSPFQWKRITSESSETTTPTANPPTTNS